MPYLSMSLGRRRTSAISSANSHDATGVSRPARIASRTSPGGLSGRISPETQTLVSTTTRRCGSPDGGDCGAHVAFDLISWRLYASGGIPAALEQTREAPLPLPLLNYSHTLGRQPCIDGLSDQFRYCHRALLSEVPENLQLAVIQIDVGASHRLYIIHHTPPPTASTDARTPSYRDFVKKVRRNETYERAMYDYFARPARQLSASGHGPIRDEQTAQ
jgi:hypothetical protein